MLGAFLGEGKNSLEGFGELWGPRSVFRRTWGDRVRTRIMVMCQVLEHEYPGIGAKILAEYFADVWPSEEGRDSKMMIQGMRAAAPYPPQMRDSDDEEMKSKSAGKRRREDE